MFRPLNKNIMLKLVCEDKVSQTIFMGNNSTNKYQVINIGKEVLEVKVNDYVYVDEGKLKHLVIDNIDYYIIDEQDVYLIVEE